MSLPADVRRRWDLCDGGDLDVIDLGFGVLTPPAGTASDLLDRLLPADAHEAAVAAGDPDVATT
jgi:hypothetical protein